MKTYPNRPTVAEINLEALRGNYSILKKTAAKRSVLAVVKANAYGHGAVKVSRELEDVGADFIGVAILEEAVQLREAGIASRILVMGGLFDGQETAVLDYGLTPVVFNLSTAEKINKESKKRRIKTGIHVKIDTGMGRIGIQINDIKTFFEGVKEMDAIDVEGLATHFASADAGPGSSGESFTKEQIRRFEYAIRIAENEGIKVPLRHAANSAALFNFPEGLFNMARPGIMLYGAYPSDSFKKVEGLRGVMTLRTEILEVKDVEKGFTVSYGSTYTAPGRRRIAVIPVGYGDGYSRALSNIGEVLVRGCRAPVVGRVCMDMTMLDVTDINGIKRRDDVYLFGGEGINAVSVNAVAEKAGTIPYEILCGISQRVPRVYVNSSSP